MTDRERLRALLVERSVRVGDFTLASGAKSSYYIDARVTTMSAQGQRLVGIVGYELIRASGLEPTHVGGLTLGADPVAYAIAHRSALEGHPIDGFTVRKRAKDHGTGRRIEGGLPAAARCIVIEDTITTGRSALEAIEVVRAHGAAVVGVLALVDRSTHAKTLLEGENLVLLSVFEARELVDSAHP
ncbi:MAG TPA: orotate phosphoribosyltransferase [Longimicrobiales bacterium]|nr:orotate phosphoribosyltransferase [Longimicrobiales bacterium]